MQSMKSQAQIQEEQSLLAEALFDPNLFVKVFLARDLWAVQKEILTSIATNKATYIKACNASGKSYVLACAVLWWLARYSDGVVISTASTEMQVKKVLWGEIAALLETSKYPFPKPMQAELRMGPKRYAIGITTSVTNQNKGVKLSGYRGGHTLVVVDEAPGLHPDIWEAIDGIMAGGTCSLVAAGNPTISSGPFYDAYARPTGTVNLITISAFDTPNLKGITLDQVLGMTPAQLNINQLEYLTTRSWVYDKYHKWGPDNPVFQSRVLGQFPTQSEYSLLSLDWLEKARIKEPSVIITDDIYAGVDVAGPGEDETTVCVRCGHHILKLTATSMPDAVEWVIDQLRPYGDRLKQVNIDSAGMGYHFYTQVRKVLGARVTAVNVGESTTDPKMFTNLKAELYWQLRDILRSGAVSGLVDDEAIAQLGGIRYEQNSKGLVKIESKEDAKKRGVDSPDKAECVMLAFGKVNRSGFNVLDFYGRQLTA